jgi:hypothetical protein
MNQQQPTPPPPQGMAFNFGNVGNRVMIQVINTVYVSPDDALSLIAGMQQAVDNAESAILVAGTMPPLPKIIH